MIEVRFIKDNDNVVEPTYVHETDVAMELRSNVVRYDGASDAYIYRTGLRIETDENYGVVILPKNNGRDNDAYMVDHVGIINSANFRDEIILTFKNRTSLKTRATNEGYKELMRSLSYGYDLMTAKCNSESRYDDVINNPYRFMPYYGGDVIGQIIVMPFEKANLIEVNAFNEN